LVLALVMSTALGPSIQNVVLAISIPIVPRAARVVRSSVLSIREMQYIEAARGLGLRHYRIAFRHVMPNTVGPFIVLCTAQLGSAILVEAALSFLGLGVPEPYPSWGRMLSVSAAEYAQKAPHLVLFPGAAISLAVFGSNLLGDALRDTLDPRLRGS
jgi:peptide/nickel transport system permease protein